MEVVKDQWFPSTGTVNGSKIRHRNPMGRQRSSSRTTERGDSETDTENIGPIDSSSARVFRSISQFHSNKTFDRSELTIPLCGSNCHISNSNDVEEDGTGEEVVDADLPQA
ncbi:uncharacterized protein LOC132303987 isoform X2 [Cornus florida]|uniref:uncharacterized protein LOC132303987 isoform X2 n=1 Tax=Cornus florida TaxID=4283 RepID=UPI002898D59D|nr:uncharacterized protein LOC132303987 isoform X2 [Cornus florida]